MPLGKISIESDPANTYGTWNTLSGTSVSTTTAILNFSDAVDTGWDLTIANSPESSGSAGVNAVGTGDAAWVDEANVSESYQYVSSSGTASYDITGLDNEKTYTIDVFGSRDASASDRVGEYSVDGFTSSVTLDAALNSTLEATFASVSPSSGKITVAMRVYSGSSYGYFNALQIEEDTGGGPTTTPKTLTHTAAGTASLSTVVIYAVSPSMVATGTGTISKTIKKTLATTATGASNLIKTISKTLTYSATGTATSQESFETSQSASMSATGTASSSQLFIIASSINKKIKGVILSSITRISKLIKGEPL